MERKRVEIGEVNWIAIQRDNIVSSMHAWQMADPGYHQGWPPNQEQIKEKEKEKKDMLTVSSLSQSSLETSLESEPCGPETMVKWARLPGAKRESLDKN